MPNPSTLIQNGFVIDGSGNQPSNHTSILIENGRIAKISQGAPIEVPPDTFVVDASGKSVIPGIFNLRGQVGLSRDPLHPSDQMSHANIIWQLGTYSSYGVTTTTSLATLDAQLPEISEQVSSGELPGTSKVLTPLLALTTPGSFIKKDSYNKTFVKAIHSVQEAQQTIDLLTRTGADYIQLLFDSRRGNSTPLDLQLFRSIIRKAKTHGLPVGASATSMGDALMFVKEEVDFLVQSVTDQEIDEGFTEQLLKSNVVYAPALSSESITFEYGDPAEWLTDQYLRRSLAAGIAGRLRGEVLMRQALDPDRSLNKRNFELASANLRKLSAAGVQIGFASGSGLANSFEGYFEYREAVFMNEAGLSPMDIIRSFSTGSTNAFGLSGDTGTLTTGKQADFIILNANPLESIHNLRELHAVFINGQLVKL